MNNSNNNQNNLNELNDILFDTMRGVKDGSIDVKRAQQISTLGTTIINGAKTQLAAYRAAGHKNATPAIMGAPVKTSKKQLGKNAGPGERLAHDLGYDSVVECRSDLGAEEFSRRLKEYKL